MKNILTKSIIVSIGLFLMMFIAGSLTSASFNIQKWSSDCRATIAIFWVIGSFASLFSMVMENEANKKM